MSSARAALRRRTHRVGRLSIDDLLCAAKVHALLT